jgi:hypothetical protein
VPETGLEHIPTDAFVDALLDWPRQWEVFRIDPGASFAADDEHLVVVALHRGRPASMDICWSRDRVPGPYSDCAW